MIEETTILIHSKQKDPFTRVPKTISEGKTGLSLKASMVLVYLIGKPIGWKTHVTDIARRFTDGKYAIRAALNELRKARYATLDPLRDENGRLSGTVWRISDRPEFCKQKPAYKHRDHGFSSLGETETRLDRVSENQDHSKNHYSKRINTTKNQAAGAAGGSGNFFNEKPNLGSCFLTRWCQTYQQWFKSPYLQKSEEISQARKVIEELKCRPKDLLAYAYRMWLNTADFDEISSEGHDPLFYQIKGSRNLRFFLSHLMEIAGEQKEPMDCAIPVKEPEFRELEEAIAEGRPD